MKKLVKKEQDFNKEMKHYLAVLNEMHGENLKGIREGFEILNKKFDNQAKVLNSHTEMIGSLMVDVSSIKSDLKKKVDYDEFLSLVKRVQNLESKR